MNEQISVEKHYFGLSAVGKIHKTAYLFLPNKETA